MLDPSIFSELDVLTFHRGADELPFFPLGDGSSVRLVHVDLATNLWVAHQKFEPGTQLLRHRHTGHVHVFTLAGAWKYLEYDDVNRVSVYDAESISRCYAKKCADAGVEPNVIVS